ncbi:MAG: DnaJ domain-containing protein [Kiloniellales bacterium]|nr:DnaJ domain-containing protein [Kiloniellales bacterium]
MIAYFILGIAILVASILLGRWFINAEPKDVLKALRWVALILGGLLALAALAFARSLLVPLLIFLASILLARGGPLWQRLKAATGPSPGQTSEITTRYLRMTLDHDSGAMNGEILEGQFAGGRLDDLDLPQLLALLQECAANDGQSAAVLEAYLDRTQPDDWREAAGADAGRAGAQAGQGPGIMTREEAYAVLGLQEGAGEKEIREAHRRLMQKIHPDLGGSNYLAAKINQAKSLLLGE